jgi:hypothetical protein
VVASVFRITTSTEPLFPRVGATAVIVVALTIVMEVAAEPPIVTVAPERKFVPVMVTAVPPPAAPVDGLMLTNVGGGGGAVTVATADPDTPVYPLCIEFAVMVAEPVPEGVNTPEEVIVPPVADQVTPVLNAPVP